ncbi:unnamed protein product [Sphenostylis stenocarpa]|uniref:Uncharacterized protein n=1 Tax=Sphenostylis stenocarpa TaxID=92480 RepID=A0AA86RWX0_9FABA|nr:unnamed protein product [Sphenostylis stenocarpa]
MEGTRTLLPFIIQFEPKERVPENEEPSLLSFKRHLHLLPQVTLSSLLSSSSRCFRLTLAVISHYAFCLVHRFSYCGILIPVAFAVSCNAADVDAAAAVAMRSVSQVVFKNLESNVKMYR